MSSTTERPPKPAPMTVDVDSIPDELKQLRRWVVWRWSWNGKKWDKPPKQVDGEDAKSNDPSTWYTVGEVMAVVDKFSGVGFMLLDSGIVGVDLDDCRDPKTGIIGEPHASAIARLNTYAEVSPSGTGVKLLTRATIPPRCPKVNHEAGFEVYDRQYFTLTGNRVPNTPPTIETRQQEVEWVLREHVAKRRQSNGNGSGNLDDIDLQPNQTDDRDVAVSALESIPNSGTGLGYDDWLRVGMALHSVDSNLLSEWIRWSAQSTKHAESECRRKWKSFDNQGDVKIGTLIHMAKERGWKPTRKTTRTNRQQNNGSAPRATSHQNASESTLLVPEGRTESANARRLVKRYGDVVRWCDPWSKWLVWDGRRWKQDDCRAIDALAKSLVDSLWREAAEVCKNADENTVDAVWRFARTSNQATGIRNLLTLTRCDVAVLPATLDTHPWLLNCMNGTLDLRTGELRGHDKADFITQLCPVEYHPDAAFPTWRGFLDVVLGGDKQLVTYVQRLVGYCLTGSTREHLLPFLYGVGANGKSTFITTILALLGEDYSIKAPTDLLLTKRDQHPTERADLFGKRFVACVEAEDGRRLAESLVKELTGSDKIRARRMREDFWEFAATHKVFLAANSKPTVRGTDHGIWRRIKLLPFTVTIADDQQDKDLPTKLLGELPGILAWSVEGCRQWQQDGLREPDCVRAATSQYRDEMDLVGRFVVECCVVGPELAVGATAIFKRFKQWCDESGERGFNQTRFGARLTERGFDSEKIGGRVVRHGLGLGDELQ